MKFSAIFRLVCTYPDYQKWYWVVASSPTEAKSIVSAMYGEDSFTDCTVANGTPAYRLFTVMTIPKEQSHRYIKEKATDGLNL